MYRKYSCVNSVHGACTQCSLSGGETKLHLITHLMWGYLMAYCNAWCRNHQIWSYSVAYSILSVAEIRDRTLNCSREMEFMRCSHCLPHQWRFKCDTSRNRTDDPCVVNLYATLLEDFKDLCEISHLFHLRFSQNSISSVCLSLW